MAGGAKKKSKASPTKPEKEKRWVSSYEELGEIFGLHRASFPRLVKRLKTVGIDAPTPRANGDHDLKAWEQFFEQYPDIQRQAVNGIGSALDEAIKDEKLRKLKRENDEAADLFLPKADVEAWLRNKVQQLRDKLSAKLKQELPAKLEGLRAQEIAAKMDPVIRDLCAVLQSTLGTGVPAKAASEKAK